MKKNSNYTVGKNKPPKSQQFKPGTSGNPKGRPKGARNFATDLAEELGLTVMVMEGNKKLALTKQQLLIKTLVTKAIKGDNGSVNALLNAIARMIGIEDGAKAEEPLKSEDREIMKAFEERILNQHNRGEEI